MSIATEQADCFQGSIATVRQMGGLSLADALSLCEPLANTDPLATNEPRCFGDDAA